MQNNDARISFGFGLGILGLLIHIGFLVFVLQTFTSDEFAWSEEFV